MKHFRSILTAAFFLAIFALNAIASVPSFAAGRPEQQRFRWKNATIKIALSSSLTRPNTNIKTDSDILGAVQRSLDAWQSAADVRFELVQSEKQSVSAAGISGDRVNLITIAQTTENVLMFTNSQENESAKTRVFYDGAGNISEADIVLNPFQQFSTDGTFGTFDLESTLTHEIGHLLGLRHSTVMGATMSESAAKNGSFGFVDLSARSLAESDLSAIRDVYGSFADDACCAAFSGRLTGPVQKNNKLVVWAEESATGRVMGHAETAADGTFRLGGLHVGTYSVYWRKAGEPGASAVGKLGTYELGIDENRAINEKVSLPKGEITLGYAGINGQLSNLAISVTRGRDYLLYVGGKQVDASGVTFSFSSPFLTISRDLPFTRDFGHEIAATSFVVSIDQNIPPGLYSIFATAPDGSVSSLIGAINVEEDLANMPERARL